MSKKRLECPSLMPENYYNSEDLYSQWRANTVYVASLYANGMLEDECASRYGLPSYDSTPCERSKALHEFVEDSFPGREIARQVCRGQSRACTYALGDISLWQELDCVTEECEQSRLGCGKKRFRPLRRIWRGRRPYW